MIVVMSKPCNTVRVPKRPVLQTLQIKEQCGKAEMYYIDTALFPLHLSDCAMVTWKDAEP